MPRSRPTATRSSSSPPPTAARSCGDAASIPSAPSRSPAPRPAHAPAWSADGRTIAFLAARPAQDDCARRRRRSRSADRRTTAAAWRRSTTARWCSPRPLPASLTRLRDGATTAATALQPGDREHAWPARAPGGFVYVAVREDGRRVMRLAANGTTRDLGTTDGHAMVVGSILLHVRGGALLAQRLDASTGALDRPRDAARERRRHRRRAGARRPHRRGCCCWRRPRPRARRAGVARRATALAAPAASIAATTGRCGCRPDDRAAAVTHARAAAAHARRLSPAARARCRCQRPDAGARGRHRSRLVADARPCDCSGRSRADSRSLFMREAGAAGAAIERTEGTRRRPRAHGLDSSAAPGGRNAVADDHHGGGRHRRDAARPAARHHATGRGVALQRVRRPLVARRRVARLRVGRVRTARRVRPAVARRAGRVRVSRPAASSRDGAPTAARSTSCAAPRSLRVTVQRGRHAVGVGARRSGASCRGCATSTRPTPRAPARHRRRPGPRAAPSARARGLADGHGRPLSRTSPPPRRGSPPRRASPRAARWPETPQRPRPRHDVDRRRTTLRIEPQHAAAESLGVARLPGAC